jgi:hypothetical protein
LRLNPGFRYALYAAFAVLFVTGAAWLVADALKDAESGEFWQETAATLLMLHGGCAMITLMLLGAMVPLHLRHGWRRGRNLVTGITMSTANAVLIVTAFGLYYLGAETLRPWMSDAHTGLGLAIPLLLVAHIWWGSPRAGAAIPDTLQLLRKTGEKAAAGTVLRGNDAGADADARLVDRVEVVGNVEPQDRRFHARRQVEIVGNADIDHRRNG